MLRRLVAAGVIAMCAAGCGARSQAPASGGPPVSWVELEPAPPPLPTDTVGPRVTGVVRGPAGDALPDASVVLRPESAPRGPPGAPVAAVVLYIDSVGSFATTLAPGVYRLQARRIGYVLQDRGLVVLSEAPARPLNIALGSPAALDRERRRLADSAATARLAARRRGASACLANAEHAEELLSVLRGWLSDRGESWRRELITGWGMTGVDATDAEVITDPALCQAAADVYGRALGRRSNRTPWSADGHWLGSVFVVRVGRAYGVEVPGSMAGEWATFLLAARTRRGLAMRDWLTY